MSWIKVIGYDESEGQLRNLYKRVAGPGGKVDNVLQVHSLRPHTLAGHMTLYKNVLHHPDNVLPKWYLEAVGVYVSHINHCDYCIRHHLEGLRRLVGESRANAIWKAFAKDLPDGVFDTKELAGLRYARLLTKSDQQILEEEVAILRKSGFDDGEILEINQVVSYFNYVNRTVTGLGVTVDGDVLGLSPGGENWSHQ